MTRTPVTVSAVDQMSLAALLVQAGVRSMHEDSMLTNEGYSVSYIGAVEVGGPVFALIKAPSDEAYVAIDAAFAGNVNITNAPVRIFLGDAQPAADADAVVTSKQLQLEMSETVFGNTNLLKVVESAVAASPDQIQIWWRTSQTVYRHNEMVEAMLPILGVSAEAADELWARAKLQPE